MSDAARNVVVDVDAFARAVRDLLERSPSPAPVSATITHEPWISIAEAAAYAGVAEDTVREWIRLQALPVGRHGRVIRLRRSNIDALLLSGASAPEGDDEPISSKAAAIVRGLTG
jgi:excisionase family DNA binding protein